MGAIACHKAQGVSFRYAPNSKNEPGAFIVFGLLMVYLVVLTVGIIAHFSIEKFESAMNVAAIAGFAVLCAAFWRSSRRNGTDAEKGSPYGDLRQDAVSGVSHPDMMPKKAGSHSTDRWGPAPTIGFLNE
jgi:hypothetical protein